MAKEISGLTLEKGGAETSHPSTPAHFDKMVDMRRTPEDRAAEHLPLISDDRNHRMSITLAGPELAKLERDADVEPGTILHFCCMAEVKASHRGSTESLELEIIRMAVENEDEEDDDDMMSDDDRMKNRYGEEEDHY